MRRNLGGLLAATAAIGMIAVSSARFDGSPLDSLLEDPVDPAAVDPAAVDPAAVDPAAIDPAAVDPAAIDYAWATGVKAEAGEGEDTSNLDWLKGTKVKDLDSLVKVARDNQKALRESGRVKVPGDNAKPEEVKAYREAIGVPETPEGYTVELPEGAPEGAELDADLIKGLAAAAHAKHIPAAAFQDLATAFIAHQAESAVAEANANNQALTDKLKEWGPNADVRKGEFKRAVTALGLTRADVGAIQKGYGVAKTMDLLAKLGGLMGEDYFSGENGQATFGVADLDSAETALKAITDDPKSGARLDKNSPTYDPAFRAKYDRLIGAVTHYKTLAKKK